MHGKTKKLEAEILAVQMALKQVIITIFNEAEVNDARKQTSIALSNARPELPFDDKELEVLKDTLDFLFSEAK